MDKNEYGKIKIDELRNIAEKLIKGEIYFIEAIREIKDRINLIKLTDEEKKLLIAIDSDTDDIPAGEVRKRWNKEALEKIDIELNNYMKEIKPDLIKICKKILSSRLE